MFTVLLFFTNKKIMKSKEKISIMINISTDSELDLKRNSTGMAEFNEKQYLDKVETFVNKNIEYLEITRGSFWKKNDIENHPRIRTNFKKLFNDLEFWNILTLKTETFSIELSNLKYHNRTFKSINNQLKLYLKKNKISPKLNNEN